MPGIRLRLLHASSWLLAIPLLSSSAQSRAALCRCTLLFCSHTYPGLFIYHLTTLRECVCVCVFSCKCESNLESIFFCQVGNWDSWRDTFLPCNWSDSDACLIIQYLARRDVVTVFPSNYFTLYVFKLTATRCAYVQMYVHFAICDYLRFSRFTD